MSAIPICYTPYGMWHAYPDRHTPADMVTMIYAAIDRGYTITRAAAAVLAKHGGQ
jgi:hypothetical protein